jgi:2-polyprenyl-6-methoxyphenol hydroxylase-like FAD-dependent oxidoreductase
MREVAIIGGGIGGLTLALELHARGIPFRVYEATSQIEALGVGINILPHASARLCALGLEEALGAVAIRTERSMFFNRFGQLLYAEPAGRAAGFATPQFSIHRGDLQTVLLTAVVERSGPDAVVTGARCTGVRELDDGAEVSFTGAHGEVSHINAGIVVACDGIHSIIRRQLHPHEGEPRYSGVNMWRGVCVHPPILGGSSMIRAGWLDRGKLVVYPIRDDIDGRGNQLVNWVAEIETPHHVARNWNRRGRLEDFIDAYEDWRFDWLDVPAMLRSSRTILEYPMVDQDPLSWWTSSRITLLGDAAHPMVPRGSNGAGQAILDAACLARTLSENEDPAAALTAYEAERRPATAKVVEMNRTNPPDAIIREVRDRTNDQPFGELEEVISQQELRQIADRYREVAGLEATPSAG